MNYVTPFTLHSSDDEVGESVDTTGGVCDKRIKLLMKRRMLLRIMIFNNDEDNEKGTRLINKNTNYLYKYSISDAEMYIF